MRNVPEAPSIAIIGGGYSGVALAANLLRRARAPLSVQLVEKTGHYGVGPAYATSRAEHVLNVPASNMHAFPDSPEHFLDWARKRVPGIEPGNYLPRSLYRDYLAEILSEAEAQSSGKACLTKIPREAREVMRASRGFRILFADGSALASDAVVLAPGNLPPPHPEGMDATALTSERYLANPWILPEIDAKESLLILGSGLTMVDVALTLHARGHRGNVLAISRHGRIPQFHRAHRPRPVELDLARMSRGPLEALRELRAKAALAEHDGFDWRTVVDPIRPLSRQLWMAWPQNERRRFLRHLRPFFEIHRRRMPESVNTIVAGMIREGRIRVRAARLVSARVEGDGFVARLLPRAGERTEQLRVDRILNCMGTGTDYGSCAPIDTLIRSGEAARDELGLGILATTEGALLRTDGEVSPGLWTLGPPRRAGEWETIAVPEIRVQAHELAHALLNRFEGEQS